MVIGIGRAALYAATLAMAAWATYWCIIIAVICVSETRQCYRLCRLTCALGIAGVIGGAGFIGLQVSWFLVNLGKLPAWEDTAWNVVELIYLTIAAHMTRRTAGYLSRSLKKNKGDA